MDQVTVSRIALIRAVEKNRAKHKDIYEKALVGYRKKLIEVFTKALGLVRQGKAPSNTNIVRPMQHVDEYDRVLGMLTMHTEDTVSLNAQEYDCYIRDKWQWAAAFTTSNAGYANRARGAMKKAKR